MITRMSHVSVYVLNQERARDFYVNKLGFKLHTDAPMGEDARWVTLTAPDQGDLEIILMAIEPGMGMTEEAATALRDLVQKGTFGFGVLETNDIYATYEELTAKGVEFLKPPKKEFYATEAIFKDDSGNWFSLTERPK